MLYIEKTLNEEEVFEYIEKQILRKDCIFQKENINSNIFFVYTVFIN